MDSVKVGIKPLLLVVEDAKGMPPDTLEALILMPIWARIIRPVRLEIDGAAFNG